MGFRTTINHFKSNEQKRAINSYLKRLEELQKHFINHDISEDEFLERNDLLSKLSNQNILLPKKVIKNSFRNYKNYLRHCKSPNESPDEVSKEVSKESPDEVSKESSKKSPNEIPDENSEHISSPLHFSNRSKIPAGFTPCSIDGYGTCCKDKKPQGFFSRVLGVFN